jgi:putative Mn2+ efflux pump MntP
MNIYEYNYDDIIHPLIFGIGSSTDNLCVGFSYGLKSKNDGFPRDIPFRHLNIVVSFCNSLGAGLAGFISNLLFESILHYEPSTNGEDIQAISKNIISLLSGLAFYYLAYEELFFASSSSDKNQQKTNSTDENSPFNSAVKLAIPMTLNNLAGGMVSGFSGIHWFKSFVAALICSYFMMGLGYTLGRLEMIQNFHLTDYAPIISGVMFGILGNEQIAEYYRYRYCI